MEETKGANRVFHAARTPRRESAAFTHRVRLPRYVPTIDYKDDEDLDAQVQELLVEIAERADNYSCFSDDTWASEVGGERSW